MLMIKPVNTPSGFSTLTAAATPDFKLDVVTSVAVSVALSPLPSLSSLMLNVVAEAEAAEDTEATADLFNALLPLLMPLTEEMFCVAFADAAL